RLINNNQKKIVADTLDLTTKQQELENARTLTKMSKEIDELRAEEKQHRIALDRQTSTAEHESLVTTIQEDDQREKWRGDTKLGEVERTSQIATIILDREKAQNDANLTRLKGETEQFVARMGALNDKVATAIEKVANEGALVRIADAVAPIAVMEQ